MLVRVSRGLVVFSFSNEAIIYYIIYSIIKYIILSNPSKPFTLNVSWKGKRKKRRTYLLDWNEIQKLKIFILFLWKFEESRTLYHRCSNSKAGIIISSTAFRRGQRAWSGSVCTIIRSCWRKWYFCIKKKLKYGIISDGLRTAAVAVAEALVKSRWNLKAHRLSSTFYNLCLVYVRAR